jgi:hypothetical protein
MKCECGNEAKYIIVGFAGREEGCCCEDCIPDNESIRLEPLSAR